jgi:microcystin-dependent protein
MSQPYIGEIRMFGGNFAPAGWKFCDGDLLAISEYDMLFNLIGTTYGGDGQSTFALPDLRGRTPAHQGTNSGTTYIIGEKAGAETVTLDWNQMPQHTHALTSTATPASSDKPGSQSIFADMGPAGVNLFAFTPYDGTNQVALAPTSVSIVGVFPSQN